jgi:hypothetical protein
MNCSVCGQSVVEKDGQAFCPSCNIYLGDVSQSVVIPKHQPQGEDTGAVYQKRAKKGLFIKLAVGFVVIFVILAGVGYAVLNFTAIGYREKVLYRYGFTTESRSYLRTTKIEVANIFESKPLGLQHSGYWKPNTESVRLNTASDEVAVHEFAHAWWEKLRKDQKTKKDLVNDTIKLSKMEDPDYTQTIKRAQWIVKKYCFCPNQSSVDYKRVDDHHFYAYMADFLMGKYKDGSHKLPEFMWKYYEGLFSNNVRKTPCYETGSCYFPNNNDAKVS